MSELFTIPETLSPRLAWMKAHGITTKTGTHLDDGEPFAEATATDPLGKHILTVEKTTEEDALIKIAELLKIKTWMTL